jgi:hypothetical protein
MPRAPMPSPQPPEKDNVPVHSFRHRNIKASIWRNQTEKGPMYNVTVVRSYREGETWRDSHSFGFDDLMNVAKLLADAHSWIAAERTKEHESASPPARSPREAR